MPNLKGTRILIVEDEHRIADDIARHFSRMGAIVLGPVPSIEEAAKHLRHADAAILDLGLNGKHVFADELVRRGVPFVFFSGHGADQIPRRLQHASTLRKPAGWDASFESFPSGGSGEAAGSGSGHAVALLPALRLAATLILSDGNAADRLVERTLERAIEEGGRRPHRRITMEWLSGLMEDIADSRGLELMH